MTKEEYLSLASEKYEALQTLNTNLNFYDYEKTFDELWTELGAVLKTKNNQIKNYIYDKLGGTLEILCHPE